MDTQGVGDPCLRMMAGEWVSWHEAVPPPDDARGPASEWPLLQTFEARSSAPSGDCLRRDDAFRLGKATSTRAASRVDGRLNRALPPGSSSGADKPTNGTEWTCWGFGYAVVPGPATRWSSRPRSSESRPDCRSNPRTESSGRPPRRRFRVRRCRASACVYVAAGRQCRSHCGGHAAMRTPPMRLERPSTPQGHPCMCGRTGGYFSSGSGSRGSSSCRGVRGRSRLGRPRLRRLGHQAATSA